MNFIYVNFQHIVSLPIDCCYNILCRHQKFNLQTMQVGACRGIAAFSFGFIAAAEAENRNFLFEIYLLMRYITKIFLLKSQEV